jgi:menaquinone-dependent protoporphyrinogen oxidase
LRLPSAERRLKSARLGPAWRGKRKNASGPNPTEATVNSPINRPRVLVSVASGHGSTTEIARVIGDTLAGHRIAVEIVPPAVVDSVEDYDAVILGSAVYAGHWLAPARDFAIRFQGPLAVRPVWLFSSGPVGDAPGKRELADVTRIRQAIPVRGHRMFAGKLDPQALSIRERTSLAAFRRTATRGDFRDWDTITEWAETIAANLTAQPR